MTRTKEPALRAAQMEGRCVNLHANYLKQNGWRFCPYCGMALQVRIHCDRCGYDYLSEKAYYAHLDLALYKANPCPNQSGHTHRVCYMKKRGKMFCEECHLEYPVTVRNACDQSKLQPEGSVSI